MLFVEPATVAAQSAAEATSTAVTAGILAGSAPAMVAVVPMASEEVSAALAAVIAAHTGEFLSLAGVNIADRAAFAADVGVSGLAYAATDMMSAATLAL